MPIRILILDDELIWRNQLAELLEEEGHIVQSAENLSQARARLAGGQFHLAVIDILLEGKNFLLEGEESGLDLLQDISRLNQEPGRFCGPVIFTGNATQDNAIKALQQGAFYYLEKSEDPIVLKRGREGKGFVAQELLRVTRKVLRRVLLERSRLYEQGQYTLRFDLAPGQKTRATLTGPAGFSAESTRPFDVDIDRFSDRADDLQFHFAAEDLEARLKWRPRAKDIGNDLHERTFAQDAELTRCLAVARTRSGRNPLHIVFHGSRGLIRLPLELLPGETDYSIMENPLVRSISDVRTVRERGIDRVFLEETPEVKILLIGSNTDPPIPGVDEEIVLLSETLPRIFSSRGFNCAVRTISTQEATYDNVYDCLRQCQYHIVHYAGHGFHNERRSDESGIAFWEKPNSSGRVKPMPIRVLRNLLQRSDTRFFYLSSCVGAKGTAEASVRLKGDDFQSIVEGLVRTGISGVLGYRWNVWDTEARQLALAFYENLLTDLRLDLALFNARRVLQEDNYYNETWASPVLVTQAP
jgi:CheY-like chemotaxis protein